MDGTEILLVDDEPQVCQFLARALSQRDFACRSATDGEQAIEEVLRRKPALVITDLRMPRRDGRWLLSELKRRWPELPVIMLTGDGEMKTAVECLKDGADDYLVKPVDVEELFIAARRALERTRILGENREQRAHLKLVQSQSERLQEAFSVIETTYRDAIGALLRAESMERPAPESPAPEVPNGKALELSGLRVAGKLIGDGAPFTEVGTAIAEELVEHDGLASVRIWIQPRGGENLEPAVDVGKGSVPVRDQAERTFSTGKLERLESGDVTSITCPIVVNGAPRAVLELVAPGTPGPTLVASAERLSLVLAASLARERDALEQRRTVEELALLYELASASRYSLDLEHVAEFLLESLHKIVDYDVASLLLLDDEEASLNIETPFRADDGFVRRVREHVLTNLKLTCGVEPPRELGVRVRGVDSPRARPAPAKLRSFVNVPLTVGGRVAGLVYVGSGRDRAFTEGEIGFVHRAANFLATSVQGVRELVAAVKTRIEQMVDQMSDGVLMLDRRGSVVAMNRAAREALGWGQAREGPATASRLSQLLDLDLLEVMRTERRSLRKVVCLRGVPYQAQLSPAVGENGDVVGAVVAFRNFQQEQKLDEMKNELVSVVSHELRTPLTAIKNALSLLDGKRLGTLNDKQHHFVRLAQRNVAQLVGIINDLLDLSKLEAGKMRIDLEPLSLAEPISAAASSLEPEAEAKGVSLESSIAEDLPLVYADAASIQRVLTNLVGNAIKFTESGGRVSVTAERIEDSGTAAGAGVRVLVSDTGVGIPRDQLESIFDKFHQVAGDNRHTTTVGTGLGLPICRELVKAHHGRIWAESEEGSGSRLFFTLPVLNDSELLLRCLEADVSRAREDGTSVVLAILSARGEGASASEGERRLTVLRDVARSVTRRSGDRVFLLRARSQVVVILPRTPGEGGAAFGERLADEVERQNASKGGVAVFVASASFPADADSADALYSRAEAALRESTPV